MIPKAKTLIEKHGFVDPDRKNILHDDIQIWVLGNFRMVASKALRVDVPADDFGLEMEYPIVDRNFIVGFIDVYSTAFHVAIEVKTSISSVGDLVRQIQFYKKYSTARKWIVVSPDDRFRNVLERQGIHFYRYSNLSDRKNQLSLFA